MPLLFCQVRSFQTRRAHLADEVLEERLLHHRDPNSSMKEDFQHDVSSICEDGEVRRRSLQLYHNPCVRIQNVLRTSFAPWIFLQPNHICPLPTNNHKHHTNSKKSSPHYTTQKQRPLVSALWSSWSVAVIRKVLVVP